jgi:hypothetical protein
LRRQDQQVAPVNRLASIVHLAPTAAPGAVNQDRGLATGWLSANLAGRSGRIARRRGQQAREHGPLPDGPLNDGTGQLDHLLIGEPG